MPLMRPTGARLGKCLQSSAGGPVASKPGVLAFCSLRSGEGRATLNKFVSLYLINIFIPHSNI